jgi:SAM-dependent methyltransferase
MKDSKGLYWAVKDSIWNAFGILFYRKRSVFLLELLNGLKKDFNIAKEPGSGLKLLDIGCGTGDITEKMSEMYDLETVGVDLNKWFNSNGQAVFLIADSYKLPFMSKSFDVVTAFSLLEHIEEESRQGLYYEVIKALTDDGVFAIQLPNRYFPIEQHSFLPFVGYLPSRLHKLFYYSYVSVPSLNETLNELTNCGFLIVKIVKYGIPFQGLPMKNLLSKVFPFGFIIIARKKPN